MNQCTNFAKISIFNISVQLITTFSIIINFNLIANPFISFVHPTFLHEINPLTMHIDFILLRLCRVCLLGLKPSLTPLHLDINRIGRLTDSVHPICTHQVVKLLYTLSIITIINNLTITKQDEVVEHGRDFR